MVDLALPLAMFRHWIVKANSAIRRIFNCKTKEIHMQNLVKNIRSFIADESGATAIEYGLIAALICVVVIATWRSIGTELTTKFKAVESGLK